MYHPTDQNGGVVRRGIIKLEDPTCPVLTAEVGEIYFLVGDTAGLEGGADVVVEGGLVEPGRCGPITTIQLRTVKAAPR